MAEKKILIVDDEDHIRELLKFNLEKNGYIVYMANDGLNGLKLAREKQVDLILLDLMLPGMDGFEVCKEIRRDNIISREILLDKIWGYEYVGETRTVDVHIRHIRKKIEEDDKKPIYIQTIRGVGYKFIGDVL